MSSLVLFSFAALIIERILQLIDWVFSFIFSPQHKVMEDLRKQILAYKERSDSYKQTYLIELEKVKDHIITNTEFENLMLISQQYVGLGDAELKDLMKTWQDYQTKRQRYLAIKMIAMWLLGFGISYAICSALDYRLMVDLGIASLQPTDADLEAGIVTNMMKLDYIFTAILLSCGTKPIHDLLSTLSAKAKGKV